MAGSRATTAPAWLAQLGGGERLQPMVDGEHQVVWLRRPLEDVVHDVVEGFGSRRPISSSSHARSMPAVP